MSTPPRRLDPCPCGSGKRFRDCHGRLSEIPEVERALQLRAAGDLEGAWHAIERALAADPRSAAAWNNRGLIAQDRREMPVARESFERALALSPDMPEAHWNYSLLLLLLGDYGNGWHEYEWRTRVPGYADYANFPFGMPRWRGEAVRGRSVLVHAEQGFGDTIQCARFLSWLARDGAAVDVFCQPALAAVLGRVAGVRRAIAALDERPEHDFHAPIVDLAAHYLRSPRATHWDGPYIHALPERIARWSPRLAGLRTPRVGIVWKGSSKMAGDRTRSLTREDAGALLAPGPCYVSLQLDAEAPQGALDAAREIRDWDDTAAIVHELDLVVAVDTAVAHFAGAMGKPVWTLVRADADWRWGLSGETTPWYPAMRLFRQRVVGQWTPVIDEVRTALHEMAMR